MLVINTIQWFLHENRLMVALTSLAIFALSITRTEIPRALYHCQNLTTSSKNLFIGFLHMSIEHVINLQM